MQHIDVGTARLAVRTTGEGPPLVAMHAGVADSRSWDDVTPAWVAAGWQVVTIDRRGHGRSTWQETAHSHAADTIAVMDALGLRQAVLVGSSQGGKVALDVAVDAPGRVTGLVLVGAAIGGAPYPYGPPAPEEEQLDEDADAAAEAGDLDEANRLEAHAWLDGPRQDEGRVGGAARERFTEMNRRRLAAPPAGEVTWSADHWADAPALDLPVLVVLGEHDFTLINAWGRGMAERLPDAEVVVMPDVAHLPMLEAPHAFAAALAPFLQRLLPTS